MSEIRFNRWSHQSGTGGIYQDSSGNIGIGTSVPTSVLDIQGGSIKIGNDLLTSSGVSTFTSGLNVTSGSVGIGTDNPNAPLHVFGRARIRVGTDQVFSVVSADGITQLQGVNDAANAFEPLDIAGSDIRLSPGSTEAVRIDSSGNVGINTNNPHSILQINGEFSPSSSGGGVIVANGTGSEFTSQNVNPQINVTTSGITTTAGEYIGLNLHNNSQTDNSYSPFLTFSRRSASGSYQAVTGGIGSRSISNGPDSNWVAGTLSLYTSGTGSGRYGLRERLKIDQEGRLTTPYQPAFSARQNSTVNVTANGEQVFNTALFNVGNHYNTTTGRFTAPVDGRYLFYFQMLTNATNTRTMLYIAKNNSTAIPTVEASAHGENYNNIRASTIMELSAGDYVSIKNVNNTTYINLYNVPSNQNWFYGYLIG